jgi:hypothetical protein
MGTFNRRDWLKTGCVSVAAGLPAWQAQAQSAPSTAKEGAGLPRLGMNLAALADWGTELPFVDLFKSSRAWISQREGESWGKGSPLPIDEQGWVRSMPPNHYAETPMANIDGGFYKGGTFLVLHDGVGELDFWSAGRVVDRAPGRLTIDVNPSRGPIWLRLKKTDPANPVRNIRVLRPGGTASSPPGAFDPDFLQRWQGITCIRFMDWMETNGSKQSAWKDRPKPTDARYTEKGVPLEVMIDLCNRLGADPWFCMPHLADDDYITQFAEMTKARLAPNLKIYVEYSNEVWNGQFQQARHAQAAAKSDGLSTAAWTAVRSVHVFSLWEKVFGGAQRLVRVFPAQAANSWLSGEMLKHKDLAKRGDVLAIAPYISLNVPLQGQGLTAAEVERWPIEKLMDHLETKALPECIGWMKAQKAIADRYGLKLVAYEGGQHLVGIWGAENVTGLTRLFHEANAHPRMGEIYQRYFEGWAEAGGGLHCHFDSMAQWSKWGSWGLLRHGLEDPRKSPKFMSAMGWAKKQGQNVRIPG